MEPEINAPKERKMTEPLTHHLSNGALGVGGAEGKCKLASNWLLTVTNVRNVIIFKKTALRIKSTKNSRRNQHSTS